jgi:murein DD-endopeptidase MepM/ murein hydrolase activator NlpD
LVSATKFWTRERLVVWPLLLALSAASVSYSYHRRWLAENQIAGEALQAQGEAHRIQSEVILFTEHIIPAGAPFVSIMRDLGVDSSMATRLVSSAQSVFNLRHLRAGNRVAVGRSVLGELRVIRYRIDTDRMLWISPKGSEFQAEIQTVPSVTETAGVEGQIRGSLFEGVTAAGEKPELAMRLADIFGWDLDFYTDTRPGDTFRVVVEKKKFTTGGAVVYGRILAAEYKNRGRVYGAVLFHDPSGNPAYYTPEGKNMKRAFLHSPLKFAAPITSHFSMARFHPILKTTLAHLGIDYAAPTGTPVQSIGEGRVSFAGPKGGAGKLIQIEHSNGFQTFYMHLSRILVHNGERIAQGQIVGLVGMTGLATGPHLDFRIERHGQFLNFEHLPLPPADPVAPRDWNEFAAVRERSLSLLPGVHESLASASANEPAPANRSTNSSAPPASQASTP